jgi:hypothetical protein
MTRLEHQHPTIAAAIATLSLVDLTARVRTLAQQVATDCGVLSECEESDDLEALADVFDNAAWGSEAATDAIAGRSHDQQFAKARAADAWRLAMLESTLESMHDAIYEALHGLGGDADAERQVVRILGI